MSPTPTAPCIRASRRAQAWRFSATCSYTAIGPTRLWLNVAYTFNDFRFDNDPVFGNNLLPGAPRHYRPRRTALQASERILYRPESRMGAAGLLCRQRQHAETDAYAILGLKAGFDDGGRYSAYVEARNIANKAYIASSARSSIAPTPIHHCLNPAPDGQSMLGSRCDGDFTRRDRHSAERLGFKRNGQ